jgi:hypothetical protein
LNLLKTRGSSEISVVTLVQANRQRYRTYRSRPTRCGLMG